MIHIYMCISMYTCIYIYIRIYININLSGTAKIYCHCAVKIENLFTVVLHLESFSTPPLLNWSSLILTVSHVRYACKYSYKSDSLQIYHDISYITPDDMYMYTHDLYLFTMIS